MYFFTRKFWRDFILQPKSVLDALQDKPKSFGYQALAFCIYWRIVFSEYRQNHCLTRSSALAYNLLLTTIPLIASASVILANIIEVHPDQVRRFLGLFLPFAPDTLNDYIVAFFDNARKLRGIGVVVTFVLAVGLFGAVEEAYNTIWKVSRARSFFMRLRTFTMAMVYSPVLFYGSFHLRKLIKLTSIEGFSGYYSALSILPAFLSVLAFAVLIWFVPNTRVRFKSALLGGLIAGILFEFERWGFGSYLRMSIQTQTIYGAFAVVVILLISLFVVSIIGLFGAEAAYVYQNFRPLLRARRRGDRRVSDYRTYIALRAMIDIIRAFDRKQPPVTQAELMERYELTDPQASGVLSSLVNAGFIHNVNGKNAYVPASDFMQHPVKAVLDTIEDEGRHVPTTPNDYSRDYFQRLLENIKLCSNPDFDGLTFAKLLTDIDNGDYRRGRIDRLQTG
jgi:membrane protein